MKITALTKFPIIVILSLVLTTVIDNTAAQGATSAGCGLVDQQDGQYQQYLSEPLEFLAGERLLVSADEPHAGIVTPSLLILSVNGEQVDSSGYPGTLEYLFISDQAATVSWGSNFSSPTWTAICPAVSGSIDDFVTTWQTDNPGTSSSTSITVPMVGGPYDVDWDNDQVFNESGLSGPVTHDFGEAGTYTIRIKGSYDSIQFLDEGDKEKIISLDQWGTQAWSTMHVAFRGAVNLQVPATDTPNFSNVNSMAQMFMGATLANPDTSGWDTSSVVTMSGMFYGATSATPDTSGWDTSSVTDMSDMFYGATSATPDTSGWDTSLVTDMSGMFQGATSADPDTSTWNTSAVTSMAFMFLNADLANPVTSNWDTSSVTNMESIFDAARLVNPDTSNWDTSSVTNMCRMFAINDSADPDTSSWDTSAVTNMWGMFYWATSATPDTSGWDTSAVTDMNSMFNGAYSANPDTSAWDTSAVTDMAAMFSDTDIASPDTSGWDTSAVTDMTAMFSFTETANPDTSSWDTSAVTDMTGMFANAISAEPDTSGWNTSAVTDMNSMFLNATSANPDTSSWDTSSVQNMEYMFTWAASANPDVSNWDVSALTTAVAMLENSGLSVSGYEGLLANWGTQALQPSVPFSAGNTTYCSEAAVAGREALVSTYGWDITDGGRSCPTDTHLYVQQAYLKASNPEARDYFFIADASGETVVIGARGEDSSHSEQSDNSAPGSGAVYVFTRVEGNWVQQAYLKASNADAGDEFGGAVAISGDTIVVGASMEDGNGSEESDNSAPDSGAAYVFTRSDGVWTQQAYLKPAVVDAGDDFGWDVDISGDTIVVAADSEDSNGSGPLDNSASLAGAAYVFTRTDGVWSQQAYLKASNAESGDYFGISVAISDDRVAVGAWTEDSDGSSELDNSALNSGAVYVFERNGDSWNQEAYLKASNADQDDTFSDALDISGDTLVVSACGEASDGSSEADDSAPYAGAAYVFRRSEGTWSQEAYLKASNAEAEDYFCGTGVLGDTIVVGAYGEDGDGNNEHDNSASRAGAAYVFTRSDGTWSQKGYLKGSNTEAQDAFGHFPAVADGYFVITAIGEASNGSSEEDNSAELAGAGYVFAIDTILFKDGFE